MRLLVALDLFRRGMLRGAGRASDYLKLRESILNRVVLAPGCSQPSSAYVHDRDRNLSIDQQTKAIRDWAKQNGYELSDRGRIRDSITEVFEAACAGGKEEDLVVEMDLLRLPLGCGGCVREPG